MKETRPSNALAWLPALPQACLWIVGVSGVLIGLFQAGIDRPLSAATAGALGIACLALSGLREIRRLSALGVEIERFEVVKKQADDLVRRSEALMNRMARAIGILAPRANRMMLGFSRQEQLELLGDLRSMMSGIEGSGETIHLIEQEVRLRTAWDIAHHIVGVINYAANQKHTIEVEILRIKQGGFVTDAVGYGAEVRALESVRERNSYDAKKIECVDPAEWSRLLKSHVDCLELFSEEERRAVVEVTRRYFNDLDGWVSGFRLPQDLSSHEGWPSPDLGIIDRALRKS